MSELGVRKLVQAAGSRHAEVAPHVLVAAEVQLLDRPGAGLKPLQPRKEKENGSEAGDGWRQRSLAQGGPGGWEGATREPGRAGKNRTTSWSPRLLEAHRVPALGLQGP